MNLKEAFRYQKFLEQNMLEGARLLSRKDVALTVAKTHKRKAANPDAEDMTESVKKTVDVAPCDVLSLMESLIAERDTLTKAIGNAKRFMTLDGQPFDMDASLDTAKFRRMAAGSMRVMLAFKNEKSIDRGTDYKFNAEGNQTPYVYEIEVETAEDFDRGAVRASMKALLKEADKLSADIERAQVETQVTYEPPFDVNDAFEDVLAQHKDKTSNK